MSRKIHATVDALGNPAGFHLTPGQAHDLEGADALLPGLEADALLADKAYDADDRGESLFHWEKFAVNKVVGTEPGQDRKLIRSFAPLSKK